MPHPVLDAPISPLRQPLIGDMALRRFSRETQRNYLRDVGRFDHRIKRLQTKADEDEQHRVGIALDGNFTVTSASRSIPRMIELMQPL
ncbi:MAG TPA: hypothetical protein VIT67_04620 [Povalibacter sp.]